jgi:tetratricopeptide (TPR) repeat protein
MLLPINLTAVLYVVQREESMANLFVMLGLIGYVAGRQRMRFSLPVLRDSKVQEPPISLPPATAGHCESGWSGFWLCAFSLTLPTAVGVLAKETAVMLPLYAVLIEWIIFRFRTAAGANDRRLCALFAIVLVLPAIAGMAWLLPNVLNPADWATRDFTLGTRLLSEARIVCDYVVWTLRPTPGALSFYHDQFHVSTGLLAPWTTLASLLVLACLVALVVGLRKRHPLVSLGIALFLGCQLLTGTILPLELVYEHRNYFASFGLMLATIPLLAAAPSHHEDVAPFSDHSQPGANRLPFALPRYALLAALMLWWLALTALTSWQWGSPLRLAQELAERAPDSPRAQYELGRTYIIYSHYDPASPYTQLAYAPLERAASFPESSILPQQALIFMNSRMGRPPKASWWDSMIAKLKARTPGVQDESSLAALAKCASNHACSLPTDRMVQAFEAALAHPKPSARLQATYGDYAWNVLGEHALGLRMIDGAVKAAPNEPAYHITLARMLAVQGRYAEVKKQIEALQALNIGGRLDHTIANVRALMPAATAL